MNTKKIRVGITQGDINGIGYEIIFKTFMNPMIFELCTPIIFGSPKVLAFHKKGLKSPIGFHVLNENDDLKEDMLNVKTCFDEEVLIEFGRTSEKSGQAAEASLNAAIEAYKNNEIDVLLTAPINKSAIQSDSFHYSGHTEFLQDKVGEDNEPLMILFNKLMRIALVTTHLPISQIASTITPELIEKKLRIFHASLKNDFLISLPRIAVLSLNPHAGDNGVIGNEEDEIIKPLITKLVDEGLQCYGPYPADGFFGAGLYKKFDGVLAMYHDQGLAPFKALSMNDGVNFTAGLPIVRTSPDHGTAYDIAGKGIANENSFRQALYAALNIWMNRRHAEE